MSDAGLHLLQDRRAASCRRPSSTAADGFVAIEDINPKADVHVLVIPERHIETFRDIGELAAGRGASACSTSSPRRRRRRASTSTG